MNYPTINIEYNRLKYKSKNGLATVYLRIYFAGKTDYIPLDKIPKIHFKDWVGDARNGHWVRNDLLVNDKINELLGEARRHVSALAMKNTPMTVKSIKDHFRNPEKTMSFNNFARDFVRNINKKKQDEEKLAYRTIQAYQSFLVKLDDFNPNIPFDVITPELLEDFKDYLSAKHNLMKTTRAKHFDKFQVIYDAAAKRKLVDFTPRLFQGYRARNNPTHVKLDIDEITKFKTTVLEDSTDDFYKVLFFLQTLTGLYFSDLRVLTNGNFKSTTLNEHQEKKTIYYLEGHRTKNDERFVIRLFPDALEIINGYAVLTANNPEQVLFPDLISEQKYNKRLKRIATLLGINKNISNKVARHSFGSWMVGIGNTTEKVGSAMGHTKDATTQIYSRMSVKQSLQSWVVPDI